MTARFSVPLETYFALTETDLFSPGVFLTGTNGIDAFDVDSEDETSDES